MKVLFKIAFILFALLVVSCSSDNDSGTEIIQSKNYKYLALGDSYYWTRCLRNLSFSYTVAG